MSKPKFQDYTDASFIDVHDVRVAYRRQGRGEPILFLHGAGLTRRWLPFYEALSKRADLIVPEHPGFGETNLPDRMTDFVDIAAHYADLLAALNLPKVHVVGHSFGGWIAAEFASIYPDKVKSLTLIAPLGLRPPEGVPLPDLFRAPPSTMLDSLLGADGEKFLAYFDEGDPKEQAIQDYVELATFARFTWNPRYDLKLEHRLRRVTAPAHIIVPERDMVAPVEVAQRYAELLQRAEVTTLKAKKGRTEHLLFLQEPDRLSDAVANFVTERAV